MRGKSPTLRRAHAAHPITALQSEYSPWTRGPEADVLPARRDLGIGFVPHAPLGRGFLAGAMTSTGGLAEDDFRHASPRISERNLGGDLSLVRAVRDMAREKGCTPAQLALARIMTQGPARGVAIVLISGTKRIPHLERNAGGLGVARTGADLDRLDRIAPVGAAAGERYTPEDMKGIHA